MAANRSNNTAGQDDNESDNAGELRNALSRARKQEVYFGAVLGKQGTKMTASKKPVKGSDLKALLQAAGGGPKFAGSCKFVDGELVLSPDKGKAPAGADKAIRACIKKETGFSWKVRIGESGGEEEQEA